MLKLKNISLKKGDRIILDQVNLEIEPQEIHSILGQNGTGKSTLAYVIMGLSGYAPTEGQIIFDGKDITHLPVYERAKLGITLAWQEPVRFEGLTVSHYLKLGQRKNNGFLNPAQCLERVGLNPLKYLSRYTDETLSGGERKRIELASVLAMKPRLVILDEPDSGIDTLSINYIVQVIRTFSKLGASVILITHHEEVASVADRASSLCGGKILKTGEPREVTRFFRKYCEECSHINQPEINHVRL